MLKILDAEKGAYAIEFPVVNSELKHIGIGKGEDMSNSEITFEAWVKSTKDENNENVLSGTIFVRGTGAFLYINSNVAKFQVGTTECDDPDIPGIELCLASGTTNINDGNWHHVAGVLTSTAHAHTTTTDCTLDAMAGMHVDIYVDGEWENCSGPLSDYPDGIGVKCGDYDCANYIGRDVAGTKSIFKGIIDEVRIWKEARTAEQIKEWKDKEITPENWKQANPYGKLVGYWKFNEGAGDIANDASGYGNSGAKLLVTGTTEEGEEITASWNDGWVTGYPF
jgi:hypothetical protein